MEIFKGLGFTAAIIFLLKLFANNFVKSWFQRDLESHKANLRLEAEREMAQIRAKNETLLVEYKEKISHLSRERIDAIKGVSQRLIAVWAALELITAFFKSPLGEGESQESRAGEEFTTLLTTANDFLGFLKEVEIFFPEDLSDRMFKFRISMNSIYMGWGGVMPRYMPDETRIEQWTKLRAKKDELTGEFNGIRSTLRVLLGVS